LLAKEGAKVAVTDLLDKEGQDVAFGILYFVSDESKFITGSELVIDGGYTCK
jgi:NAD(P)-dependent dehydrogenase (short-subunit alcohol dehydrogenase family)